MPDSHQAVTSIIQGEAVAVRVCSRARRDATQLKQNDKLYSSGSRLGTYHYRQINTSAGNKLYGVSNGGGCLQPVNVDTHRFAVLYTKLGQKYG